MRGSGASSGPSSLAVRQARQSRLGLIAGIGVAALVASVAVAWILGVRHGGTPAREIASIAVLPFADMSQARDQECFSDGLSEELLDVLAKVSQLRVIGRTSSFQFKGKNEDLRVIAQKLGVDHLLEGSVRKEGNRVRVTAQLIRASDGSHLWSETYDRTLEDVFKVQDEIADAVAQALKVTLLDGGLPERMLASSEAHNLYLEGNASCSVGRRMTTRKPSCRSRGRSRPMEGSRRRGLGSPGSTPSKRDLGSFPRSQEANRRGMRRSAPSDSTQSSSRRTRRWCTSFTGYDWDWAGAEVEVQQVLTLNPGNADALYSAGILARTLGRFDEAISLYRRALARDPLSVAVRTILA